MTASNTSNNKRGIDAAIAGNHIEAENHFRQAIAEDESGIEGYMNLIRLLSMQSKHRHAIEMFKELAMKIEAEKIHPQILYMASQSALNIGDQRIAIQNLQILMQQNPGNSELPCMLSRAFIESGQLMESKRMLEKAIKNDPGDPSLATQLAITESELGNYDKADEIHRQLTQKHESAFLSHFNYGLFLVNIGNKDKALSCFERCKQIVPHAPEAQEQIEKLLNSDNNALAAIYREIENKRWNEAVRKLRENQQSIEPIQFWAAVNEIPKEQQIELVNIEVFDEEKQIKTVELYSKLEKKDLEGLIVTVKNTQSLIWNRAGKPTRNGLQSHEILNGSTCNAIQDLCDRIKAAVGEYIKDKPLLQKIRAQRDTNIELSGWGVVLKKGGHQKRHIHPESVVSGVIYIKIPTESADENKKEGNLAFPSNNMKMITPREGMAVLFPSYLAHETIPIKSDKERICIAFNAN